MRYTIKAGAGSLVIKVVTKDPREALRRATELVRQGRLDVVVIDGEGESRTPGEFRQLIGEADAAILPTR